MVFALRLPDLQQFGGSYPLISKKIIFIIFEKRNKYTLHGKDEIWEQMMEVEGNLRTEQMHYAISLTQVFRNHIKKQIFILKFSLLF